MNVNKPQPQRGCGPPGGASQSACGSVTRSCFKRIRIQPTSSRSVMDRWLGRRSVRRAKTPEGRRTPRRFALARSLLGRASVLECARPLALLARARRHRVYASAHARESAGGPAHSRTLRAREAAARSRQRPGVLTATAKPTPGLGMKFLVDPLTRKHVTRRQTGSSRSQ